MKKDDERGAPLHRRRITLADGRYLIFYTFEDAPAPSVEDEDEGRPAEPRAAPQAEEERSV